MEDSEDSEKKQERKTPRILMVQDKLLLRHFLDPSFSGYVTPSRFSDFLTLFGPLDTSFERVRTECIVVSV